jgi:hypothetical protein
MFSRGTDFSVAAGANSDSATANSVLPNLASSLGTVTTTGTGVFIFSTLTYVGNSVCASLNGTNGSTVYGVAPSSGNAGSHTGNCTNWGKFVFTQQYVVGNSALRSSNFGTPTAADVVSTDSYKITLLNSVTDTGNVSTFSLLPAPAELGADGYQSGQPIYVVEAFFSGSGQAGYTQGGDYAYAVF